MNISFCSIHHALSKYVKIFENFYFIKEILREMSPDLGSIHGINLIYYEAKF